MQAVFSLEPQPLLFRRFPDASRSTGLEQACWMMFIRTHVAAAVGLLLESPF